MPFSRLHLVGPIQVASILEDYTSLVSSKLSRTQFRFFLSLYALKGFAVHLLDSHAHATEPSFGGQGWSSLIFKMQCSVDAQGWR